MVVEIKHKKSPRAPTMPLDEAIARVARIYKEEGRHCAPVEVAMRHIGYGSKNGAALSALASLGYWGLVERPKDGLVMVAKSYEDYEFSPDEQHKNELLAEFLRKPALFQSLLDHYKDRLPSDATLKYDLIQRGFRAGTADTCMAVFKRSVEFAHYFERTVDGSSEIDVESDAGVAVEGGVLTALPVEPAIAEASSTIGQADQAKKAQPLMQAISASLNQATDPALDRIPVRLARGRRAWLEIPIPFFNAGQGAP